MDSHGNQWLEAACKGDDDAFARLIAPYQTVMYRYAYLIVRDAQTAEDVAQEALWRVYRKLHTYDAAQSFKTWVLTITLNTARNRRRAWGRYQAMVTRVIDQWRQPQASSADAISPEAVTEQQQDAQMLHEAVS